MESPDHVGTQYGTLGPCAAPLLSPPTSALRSVAPPLRPLPLAAFAESAPLHVTATPPRNAPRRPGVVGHSGELDRSAIRQGVPVSDAATLFLELAPLLPVDALVAVGDAPVRDPAVLDPGDERPWIALGELRSAVAAARSRSVRRTRRAAELVREGSDSPRETQLRLLLGRAGLPEPELNVEIADAAGNRIGRFDLVYRPSRVIVEYDGEQHRTDRAQFAHDIRRLERAADAGWHAIRVLAGDLGPGAGALVARVRTALTRRGPASTVPN